MLVVYGINYNAGKNTDVLSTSKTAARAIHLSSISLERPISIRAAQKSAAA